MTKAAASTGRCPVVHFDHNSAEHSKDPVASYRSSASEAPVAWTDAHGGYWVLSGYQAVFEAARHDDTFSSERNSHGGEGLSVVIPKTPAPYHIPIEIDPPEFRKWRRLINPITAPAAIDRMERIVKHFVTSFVDDIIETGECDMTSVIGVPSIVTVDWLGLPIEHWERYAFAFHALLVQVPGTEDYDRAVKVDLPFLEGVRSPHHRRAAWPSRRTTSSATWSSRRSTGAGSPRTRSSPWWTCCSPAESERRRRSSATPWCGSTSTRTCRQDLIDHPEKLDRAIEEFLRFFSPTQGLARTVTKDVEFQGCPMKEGDRVLLAWASANRDPELFENPDELDIERWPNRHTAFGIGVHRCAGSHLGRAMAKELLTQILEPDERLRGRPRPARAVPPPGHQQRLEADPGHLHTGSAAAPGRR